METWSPALRLAVIDKMVSTQLSLVPGFIHTDSSRSMAAAAAKSLQSCLTLCNPIDGSPPGSPVPGILQARTLEWVAISFSNAWKWKVKSESEVAQSCLTLSDPMDCSPPGSSIHRFSRQEYWSGLPLLLQCMKVRSPEARTSYEPLPQGSDKEGVRWQKTFQNLPFGSFLQYTGFFCKHPVLLKYLIWWAMKVGSGSLAEAVYKWLKLAHRKHASVLSKGNILAQIYDPKLLWF